MLRREDHGEYRDSGRHDKSDHRGLGATCANRKGRWRRLLPWLPKSTASDLAIAVRARPAFGRKNQASRACERRCFHPTRSPSRMPGTSPVCRGPEASTSASRTFSCRLTGRSFRSSTNHASTLSSLASQRRPCFHSASRRSPWASGRAHWTTSSSLATKKTPLLAESTLARNGHFEFELANADTALRAARALLYESAESVWATAARGTSLSLEDRARIRAAAVWTTNRATEVVTSAYRAGGGSSVYASSPLQRRLRDVNALTQHFLVRNDTLTTAGAILAGQDVR